MIGFNVLLTEKHLRRWANSSQFLRVIHMFSLDLYTPFDNEPCINERNESKQATK